ncbi:MAG: fused MFS/spermidine synthase [Deltaproteobacteria bacterium]|nr:fused MFS/spermidine synthase [Deltaproteobacteria bacterium]
MTSGISAFLLFLVQPLIGKTLLPLYGGSASVWTTCLLFFQTVLLAGYAYTHLLLRSVPKQKQLWLHGIILLIAVALSRILPDEPPAVSTREPVFQLLLSLMRYVGVPFFALSATAPLLQHWFHQRYPHRSPYPLYAVSNAGSFAAVIAYPFLVERFFTLNTQEFIWSTGFGLFALACMASGWIARMPRQRAVSMDTDSRHRASPTEHAVSLRMPRMLWFGFSAAGSTLLITTTEQISQDVAATPLFWMIPLCLYLLTYVICFSADRTYHRKFWLAAITVATGLVAAQVFFGNQMPMAVQLTLYVITLFIGCMVAHGELARVKPGPNQLTRFYLWTSLGGIFGGLSVAVIAPIVFPDLWEYSLIWPVLMLLIWKAVSRESTGLESEIRNRRLKLILSAGIAVSSIGFVVDVVHDNFSTVYSARNFYGRLTIADSRFTRCLYHGRTLHGCQPKKEKTFKPAFYYAPSSGMGMTQQIYRDIRPGPIRTGVVGLGAGICSVWNRPEDTMIFYEIDPAVVAVAQSEFDYIKRAQGTVAVRLGDARLSLAAENRINEKKLDILVMDAFSSDAIPLHLLTKEAVRIYRDRVRPGGVFVFHISNRHINLEPLMLAIAEQTDSSAFVVYTATDYENYILDTTWVIITDNGLFIEEFRKSDAFYPWPEEFKTPLVFTDNYSNILELL